MSLIIEFVSRYKTKVEALASLNDILGTKIKLNRLYEWCDPDNARELPPKIANPLRGYMLKFLLDKEKPATNLTEDLLSNIFNSIYLHFSNNKKTKLGGLGTLCFREKNMSFILMMN